MFAPARIIRQAKRAVAAATLCAAIGAPGFASANDAPAPVAPVAVSAKLVEEGKIARLTFDLSSSIQAHAFALADPDRIVVDIPEVNFQVDPAIGRPHRHQSGAIVQSFRFGMLGPGKSRIVIDLGQKACIEKLVVQPIAPGAEPARLEIELAACDPAAFAQTVRAEKPGPAAPSAPASEVAAAPPGLPVIVLDPGHGGIDGGANGPAGEMEKTIVYEFTRQLARKLEESKKFKIILTRNGDEFVSLGDRVKVARAANAALLISIHADTLAGAADVSGATVYTLADRASDAVAARVAESENAADKAAGVEQKAEDAGVADILFDLKRRETRTYAHLFSREIVKDWRGAGRLNRNPERSAGFVVLKAPDFPSVLAEIGYLSSRGDVKSMNSPDWRNKATDALANSVERFFSPRSDADAVAPGVADEAPQDSVSVVEPVAKSGGNVH